MNAPSGTVRAARWLAAGLAGYSTVAVIGAGSLSAWLGWSWQGTLDAFVVSNALIGFSFAACGAVVAWHRPRNPIGWLFLLGGAAQSTSALMPPLGWSAREAGASTGLLRLLETIFAWSWPWSIGLCLPLALLLFPTGRPLSRTWRWVVIAVAATGPLFAIYMGAAPGPTELGFPPPYLTLPFYDDLGWLWRLVEIRTLLAMLLAAVSLVLRYRRGTETERRQLLWLVLATLVAVLATIPWGLVAGTPVFVLFTIALIPIAVALGIVRYQLFDIRFAVSRALAWLLLAIVVVAGYVVLVALLDRLVSAQLGRSAFATVVLVLAAAPLLPRLTRLTSRLVYGERHSAARAASQLGERLAQPGAGLVGLAEAVREALRLPYVAITGLDDIVAAAGAPSGAVEHRPLIYDGRDVGELVVGLRRGERRLGSADGKIVALLAGPIAAAVHATALAAELQGARERLVAGREAERRRVRRDLHDGLGPTLTGLAFAADAATNQVRTNPDAALALLADLRREIRGALADVRRLVDDLRPDAVDEFGLVGALQRRVEQLSRRTDGHALQIRLDLPASVPELPAAVEVATYRIATEALNNVARHSTATSALVQIRCGERLELAVLDNGRAASPWSPGVGLQAMQERAAELGGVLDAGPTAEGGRVLAAIPVAAT